MLIACITDQHFGARNDNPVILDNQQLFYEDVFFPKIDELGIKNVIDLGDTFDKRKSVNISTLSRSRSVYFDHIKDRGIQLDVIIGNHTAFYKDSNAVNTIDMVLDGYDNIRVIRHRPEEVDYDGLRIMLMPWINKSNLTDCLEAVKKNTSSILMAHLELEGFTMQKGTVCKHGMKASTFNRAFDQVYSGHFHSPSSQGNITYLGSPYETTWADYGDVKGFHILDTETSELTLVHNPHGLHMKVNFEDRGDWKDSDFEGKIVRLVINTQSVRSEVLEVVDHITNMKAAEVKTIDNYVTRSVKQNISLDVEDLSSTKQMIDSYVDEMPEDRPRDDVKTFLHKLYDKAIAL